MWLQWLALPEHPHPVQWLQPTAHGETYKLQCMDIRMICSVSVTLNSAMQQSFSSPAETEQG